MEIQEPQAFQLFVLLRLHENSVNKVRRECASGSRCKQARREYEREGRDEPQRQADDCSGPCQSMSVLKAVSTGTPSHSSANPRILFTPLSLYECS